MCVQKEKCEKNTSMKIGNYVEIDVCIAEVKAHDVALKVKWVNNTKAC